MRIGELYASAAATIADVANQLAGGGASPEAATHYLQATLHELESLIAAENSPDTIAGLDELVRSLRTAGAITSDRAFQIADMLNRIATGYGDLAAGLNGLW